MTDMHKWPMRLNKYIALSTGLSRRAADEAIYRNRVTVNGGPPALGQQISQVDRVTLDNRTITPAVKSITIMLNKPAGYVVSREGQGSKTIYEFLTAELQTLKPIGRLDKDSSGLLLITNDGQLAQELTHPKYRKTKLYEITLDKPLAPMHRQIVSEYGISLEDGLSRLQLDRLKDNDNTKWQVTMREGRNRQIRRTFAALGYNVTRLHRTVFGNYKLGALKPGDYTKL